jgi:hypothetical protein
MVYVRWVQERVAMAWGGPWLHRVGRSRWSCNCRLIPLPPLGTWPSGAVSFHATSLGWTFSRLPRLRGFEWALEPIALGVGEVAYPVVSRRLRDLIEGVADRATHPLNSRRCGISVRARPQMPQYSPFCINRSLCQINITYISQTLPQVC